MTDDPMAQAHRSARRAYTLSTLWLWSLVAPLLLGALVFAAVLWVLL